MSFGEWRAHAQPSAFARDVELNIGREVSPGRWDLVTAIDVTTGVTVSSAQEVEGQHFADVLRVPADIAEAMYKALDRLYGQENTEGKVEALQSALEKEQSRVDLIITNALGLQPRPATAHRFEGKTTS